MSTRRTRCGKCDGCLAVECRKCKHCLDMKKNGGPGNLRRPCVDRVCRAIQAAPTKKEVAERNKPKSEYGTYKGGEEQKGGGLEGQLAAERCRAEAAKPAKAPPPPRVIGGETFVCKDFIRLAKALEVTMRGDGSLDYEAASAILLKEEPARVKYIEKLKEEVRLWDEGVPEEITPDWVPEARKAADAEEKRQQRWTPARCRALWRWGAYGYDEKAEGVLDLAESDDDIVTSFLDPLTMAVGKRAPGPARDADTYLGVADPDTRVPREIDEKELEAIRAKYPAPPSPRPRRRRRRRRRRPARRRRRRRRTGPARGRREPPPAPAPAPTIHRPSSDAEKARVDDDGWIVKNDTRSRVGTRATTRRTTGARGRTIERLESAMATWMCRGNLKGGSPFGSRPSGKSGRWGRRGAFE